MRGLGGHERSAWQQAIFHACTAHGECTCCDSFMACAMIAREDITRDPMIVDRVPRREVHRDVCCYFRLLCCCTRV